MVYIIIYYSGLNQWHSSEKNEVDRTDSSHNRSYQVPTPTKNLYKKKASTIIYLIDQSAFVNVSSTQIQLDCRCTFFHKSH